jgi:hypothetical protein
MEMWWRAAALDALQARCPVAEPPLMLMSSNVVCTGSAGCLQARRTALHVLSFSSLHSPIRKATNKLASLLPQAYISGPLAQATGQECARLHRTVALLLAPTLEALASHAAMQARCLLCLPRRCACCAAAAMFAGLQCHAARGALSGQQELFRHGSRASSQGDSTVLACMRLTAAAVVRAGPHEGARQLQRRICRRCRDAAAAAAGVLPGAARLCGLRPAARGAHQALLPLAAGRVQCNQHRSPALLCTPEDHTHACLNTLSSTEHQQPELQR